MNRFLRRLAATAIAVLSFATAWGQDPVTWKAAAKQIDGDIFEVTLTASIESPWHMYDMGPYEGGPLATTVTVDPGTGAELVGNTYTTSKATVVMDQVFNMEIGYFENSAVFVQRIRMKAAQTQVRISAEWMVCNDASCMPPSDAEFDLKIDHPAYGATATKPAETEPAAEAKDGKQVQPASRTAPVKVTYTTDEKNEKPAAGTTDKTTDAASGATATADASSGATATADPATVTTRDSVATPAIETESDATVTATGSDDNGRGIWGFVLEAILWGLAALLTPCVFPMIPMTISFFLKNQGNPAKGRFMAAMYGLFIVALYTLPIAILIAVSKFVGGDDMTAGFFNWLSTHWVPNLIFFIVFMVFAASFFGAFEITMPSRLVNKSDSRADRGGIAGTFFMALTLVLVSFSCTGPIVGTVLIKSAQGEVWTPVITMLAFSLTFAVPFTLFAIFPSLMGRMKSGSWLNSVKVTLGFIEVALGLKFLSVADQTYHWGILDREIYLAIWIVVFTLLGFYLLGKLRFKHDSELKHISVVRLLLAIASFSFAVYMLPGMWGAPLKGLSGYLPPISTQDFVIGQATAPTAVAPATARPDMGKIKYADKLHLPHSLEGFFDLEQAQEYAARVDKPLFIDITGHGCVNCREMEQRVWSDPRVLDMLRRDFVIVALYTDDKLTADESDWITTSSGKVLKQIGKINTYKANTLFGVGAQPYYIITGKGGSRLADHQYDLSVDNFIAFLNKGLTAYKSEK